MTQEKSCRRGIPLSEKAAIIAEYEASGGTMYATAKKHKIQANQLSRWIKSKDKLREFAISQPTRLTMNATRSPRLENTQNNLEEKTNKIRKRNLSSESISSSSTLENVPLSDDNPPQEEDILDIMSKLRHSIDQINQHQQDMINIQRKRIESDRKLQEERLAEDQKMVDITRSQLEILQSILQVARRGGQSFH